MKFQEKTKKVEFQGQELEIKGISVTRALALRGQVNGEGDQTEDNLKAMAEVIADCVVDPVITVAEVMDLTLEVFNDLFDVVSKANGLVAEPEGNVSGPATT